MTKKITQKCSEGNTNLRARNYCVTLNNYSDSDYTAFCECDCKYIIVGKEIGESGTPHLQTYVEFKEGVTLSTLKKRLSCKKLHAEVRRGTSVEASDYCKKDGDYFEKGTISKQGAREDLKLLKASIFNGSSVDEICEDNPVMFHQYGRTLNKLEELHMRKIWRTEMTLGIWYYGKTGVGKSHKALADFDPNTHYIYPNDKGWWDGYKQQGTVVFNEFRGELDYKEMLDLVDKWPKNVARRGREPLPFTSKHIIVTSSKHPKEIYGEQNPETGQYSSKDGDNFKQLERRFKIIKLE